MIFSPRTPLVQLSLVIALAGVGWLALKWFSAAPSESSVPSAPSVPSLAAAATPFEPWRPSAAQATRLLDAARLILTGRSPGDIPEPPAPGTRLLVLSLSRSSLPALVAEGRGAGAREALARASESLARRARPEELLAGRLRLDVLAELGAVESFDERGRAVLDPGLDGLFLPAHDLMLLASEIASRGLVNSRGDLQSKRLARYLAEGNRGRGPLRAEDPNPGRPGASYRRAAFASFVEGAGGSATAVELYPGNPTAGIPSAAQLLAAARSGGDYLVRHSLPDGRFNYLYRSESDTVASSYNLLRHAGSCYALFELHRATGDPAHLAAGRRGVEYLLTQVKGPRPEHRGETWEAIAPPDEEAKLGGAALAILAILEHRKVTRDDRWLDRARALARFILFQQEASGRFESKYFFDPKNAEPFESIYYPGEAILALTRLHDATGERRWLEAAQKAARWLIDVRDAGKGVGQVPHDHWLLMGLSELHPKTGDAKFLAQARKIAEAILGAEHRNAEFPDWNGGFYDPPRSTPTATRAEALVAMHRLARGNGLDPEPYRAALLRFAAFQLRCQITPENAFFLPRPDRALGGFRSSLTDGDVRIDYVQHSASSLLGLREILLGG